MSTAFLGRHSAFRRQSVDIALSTFSCRHSTTFPFPPDIKDVFSVGRLVIFHWFIQQDKWLQPFAHTFNAGRGHNRRFLGFSDTHCVN